jgi:hypothetical protein
LLSCEIFGQRILQSRAGKIEDHQYALAVVFFGVGVNRFVIRINMNEVAVDLGLGLNHNQNLRMQDASSGRSAWLSKSSICCPRHPFGSRRSTLGNHRLLASMAPLAKSLRGETHPIALGFGRGLELFVEYRQAHLPCPGFR